MKHIIYGHRGIPSLAPENSLKSFQLILDYKIPGVEFDIHLTGDNKLVVIHDYNSKKVSGMDYDISKTDYKNLSNLDIGDRERIPLLSEVFELLGNGVLYDLEIKNRGKKQKTIVSMVLEQIERYNLSSTVMVTSFDPFIIKEFNRLRSGITTGIIYCNDKKLPFISRFGFGLLITKCKVIKPHISQLRGPLFFIYSKILRKKCYTWTVNTKEDREYAYSKGCVGICSDYPQNLRL